MTDAIGIVAVFCLVLGLMALGITRGFKRKLPKSPQPKIGMWVVDALLWSHFAPFGNPSYNDRVTGEVIKVNRNGTMTVRDWESGDELCCLGVGFLPADPHEEQLMRELRADQDIMEMGESPSKYVN
jgi:hypothetical protein